MLPQQQQPCCPLSLSLSLSSLTRDARLAARRPLGLRRLEAPRALGRQLLLQRGDARLPRLRGLGAAEPLRHEAPQARVKRAAAAAAVPTATRLERARGCC